MTLTTSFALLRKANACEPRYSHLGAALGGIKRYGKDTPITLLQILDANGFEDTLWAIRAVEDKEQAKILSVKFAIACSEHILHLFKKEHQDDKRPRQAIEAAKRWLAYPTEENEKAAEAAARAAARVASLAAFADSWAAAEREWQTDTLLKLLSE